jgi:hypothetical protein
VAALPAALHCLQRAQAKACTRGGGASGWPGVGHRPAGIAEILLAKLAGERAGVDADRAGGFAQATGGTGFITGKLATSRNASSRDGSLAALLQRSHFAVGDNALARRQGDGAAGAHHFAEAALDALVDQLAVGIGFRLRGAAACRG